MQAARWGLMCAAALIVLPGSVHAADSGDYERQIKDLETRVHQLETMITELKGQRAPEAAGTPAGAQSAAASGGDGAPAAGDAQNKDGSSKQAKRELSSEDRTLLQDLFVVRDQSVTLDEGHWELTNEFSYVRAGGFLQQARGFAVSPTIRYGFGHGFELSVGTSENWTHRESQTGTRPLTEGHTYLGDVNVQLNWIARHESKDLPGVVVYGGLVIPTGPAPYVEGEYTAGKNPTSVFGFYQNTTGHYVAKGGVQAFRTFSPFVLFGGFGVSYALPRDYGGLTVAPGYTITYNLGYTFTVSEATSLGMMVLGAYTSNMSTGGIEVPSSGNEPVSVRFSVLQRLAKDFYVEPAVTLGLTDDTPSSIVSLNTRFTF